MLTSGILSPVLSRSIFELCVALIGALSTSLGALWYFTRVRLERPAIGRFNGRDVVILLTFLILLPVVYLVLPQWAVIALLSVTFMASLSIGFRPLVGPTYLWLGIGLLVGGNIWLGQHILGTVPGWQVFWLETSVIVLLGAISVANLYVQGGMQLRHVAWFALGLAVYDVVFTIGIPVSNLLVREFVGHPLFPAMGMRIGFDEAIIGLGDLLVYGLFMVAAFKAYGRPGVWLSLVLILVFGAAMPSLSSLLINYIDARADIVIPAQTWFGPAGYFGYRWLRHKYGRERTMKEFLETRTTVTASVPTAEPALVKVPQ